MSCYCPSRLPSISKIHANIDIVVITGASPGGIGSATALGLAHAKPKTLVLTGRSLEKIQPVIDDVKNISPETELVFVQLDLSSLADVRRAAEQVLHKVGEIDGQYPYDSFAVKEAMGEERMMQAMLSCWNRFD